MKKLLLLGLSLFVLFNFSLLAQGTNTQHIFAQNPATQASIIAASDDMIEEIIDEETGEVYFIRQTEATEIGAFVSMIVTFDAASATFVDVHLYTNGEDEVDDTCQKPCPTQQDSCIRKQPNLLHNQVPVRPKPHRSSRVKLADDF